jgi:hypothetical protein
MSKLQCHERMNLVGDDALNLAPLVVQSLLFHFVYMYQFRMKKKILVAITLLSLTACMPKEQKAMQDCLAIVPDTSTDANRELYWSCLDKKGVNTADIRESAKDQTGKIEAPPVETEKDKEKIEAPPGEIGRVQDAQLDVLSPEQGGPVSGPNTRESMGGGYAEAQAIFYRDGLTVIETHSVSTSYTQGTKGSVFIVGSDRKGRSLFASPVFDIPTACSKPDTCSSNRRGNVQHRISGELAKYMTKIDVYVQDRSGGRSARETINTTIKESCGAYDDLPAAAKAGIAVETGFAGCGPQ